MKRLLTIALALLVYGGIVAWICWLMVTHPIEH